MDYLDRTQADEWSPAYSSWLASTGDLDAFRKEYGDPQLGYHWGTLFLPNGTKISMNYKGRVHAAEVRQQRIVFEGVVFPPSELASRIANNTSRNAWRDLLIKRPTDESWCLADTLRRTVGG
ncbi:MAG: hypothetical protein IPJ98_20725 [Bryobacterales bacterium]|nr:hypothetical protein [Bryobacterales bacterium]